MVFYAAAAELERTLSSDCLRLKGDRDLPDTSMTTRFHILLASWLVAACMPFQLSAQLVPDGGTINFTGSTNLVGPLNVGENNGFTTLNIIAPGTLTNGIAYIGRNVSSDNNLVSVQNGGAIWDTGTLHVG